MWFIDSPFGMGVSMFLALLPIVGVGVLVYRETKHFEQRGGSAIAYLLRVSAIAAGGLVGMALIVGLIVGNLRVLLIGLGLAPLSSAGAILWILANDDRMWNGRVRKGIKRELAERRSR